MKLIAILIACMAATVTAMPIALPGGSLPHRSLGWYKLILSNSAGRRQALQAELPTLGAVTSAREMTEVEPGSKVAVASNPEATGAAPDSKVVAASRPGTTEVERVSKAVVVFRKETFKTRGEHCQQLMLWPQPVMGAASAQRDMLVQASPTLHDPIPFVTQCSEGRRRSDCYGIWLLIRDTSIGDSSFVRDS